MNSRYARTGKLTAQPGLRDQLAEILIRASQMVSVMPGCQAYIILEDTKDENAVWVFELWDDEEAHAASLRVESVRALIAEAMPILGGAPAGSELRVLGGYGMRE